MELNIDKLFNSIINICKNEGFTQVHKYFNKSCQEALVDYSNMISRQSDYYFPQSIYFYDKNEKIIYIEHGWCDGAHQLLLKFNENFYKYDSYELPDKNSMDKYECYPESDKYKSKVDFELAEKEYFDFWNKWILEHKIESIGNIFNVLKLFDEEEDKYFNKSYFNILNKEELY